MNNYPTYVKEKLYSIIEDMGNISWIFCKEPGKNFTRSRKLSFQDTIKLILSMEGGTVNEEMMEYFDYNLDLAPSQSAFNQRRSQFNIEAFEYLFLKFVEAFPQTKYMDNYRILACDGSHVVYATNPENVDDYVKPYKPGDKGYNQLHLNALYDILNRTFVDAIIQPGVKQNEHAALHEMMEHFQTDDPNHTIITVDRGYESYNLIAQLREKDLRFVIRAKDFTSANSLLSYYKDDFPNTDEFDVIVKRFISRRREKDVINNRSVYRYLRPKKNFQYLSYNDEPSLYYIEFRVVRIKLSEDNYECLITNLPEYVFSPDRLKEIYHMRWDIETAFRQLKYAVGMMNFHAKKVEYIKQEIFAKLILHNFSEIIASQASISQNQKKHNKHNYKLNYSMAAKICHKFLKLPANTHPPDIIGWIQRFLSVDKCTERSFPRALRGIGAVSFHYRVA